MAVDFYIDRAKITCVTDNKIEITEIICRSTKCIIFLSEI